MSFNELELKRIDRTVGELGGGPQTLDRLAIFALVFLAAVVFGVGRTAAATETTFYVTQTSPEQLVVRLHSDVMLLLAIDRDSNQVGDVLTLRSIDSNNGIQLRQEVLGRLVPADDVGEQ